MGFWTGFFAGVAATYALSISVVIAIVVRERLAERRAAAHAARLTLILGYDPVSEEPSSPEYPTVRFTHVTGIGTHVRGGDG